MLLQALDPPGRPVTFHAQPNTSPAPDRIKLKLFSANSQHVDAQAVTII
jgi:hypothetical protein